MSKKEKELEISIKYFADIPPVEQKEYGAWIDLCCAEDVKMQAGDFKLIPLGIAMKLPEGYEAHVAPRSSTYKKWSIILANSMGIIDPSYCGSDDQWMFPAICLIDTFIPKGTRICQFRIEKEQPKIGFKKVTELDAPSRGGIGSTGD